MYKLSNVLLACVLAFSVNAQENAGLRLPAGFSATLFADQIGTARHITINDKGVLFAKLNNANKAGQSIVRMEDANGDGIAEKQNQCIAYTIVTAVSLLTYVHFRAGSYIHLLQNHPTCQLHSARLIFLFRCSLSIQCVHLAEYAR